jgi:deoxyribonuclease-4
MQQETQNNNRILLGAHFSIAGGLHKAFGRASEYGCTALQIFTKNANTWKERSLCSEEIERFRATQKACAIPFVCAHGSYLINLASPDGKKRRKSITALANELLRASQLSIPYLIIHPGAHMGMGERQGISLAAQAIERTFERVPEATCQLLLETTAGQGSTIGHRFQQLAAISNAAALGNRIGFCLDTSHIFAAGYDLRTKKAYEKTMEAFVEETGIDHLKVIHVNDSKKPLGSRVDRHEHIGQGAIGIEAFKMMMNDPRLTAVPKIIETPKEGGSKDYDRKNLDRLRSLIRQETS